MVRNILSIDVESWVHFYKDALILNHSTTSVDRKVLDNNYIPIALDRIFALLKKYNQKATFFVVAEIYDWYPNTIEEILTQGHADCL